MLDELTDEELAKRCREGHQAAWSTLVRRFQRLIFTIPRRAGLSEEQAADVFQSTFSRFYENIDRIDDLSRIQAWLVTTARRETLRCLEESKRVITVGGGPGGDGDDQPNYFDQLADTGPLPHDLLVGLEDMHRLRLAVDQLEPRSRQLVELLFLQDEAPSYGEIAQRLGIAEGSIGPTRARCIEKLRALLQKM
jgi:RNA polymerase sigma factor (sigma-70 family)